jgi:hypothetical protein
MNMHLLYCMLLILAGVCFNLLVKLATKEEEGHPVTPWVYVSSRPYRSALLVVSTVMCALLLHFIDQLDYSTSVLLGISADLVADRMRARAAARIGQGIDEVGQRSGV